MSALLKSYIESILSEKVSQNKLARLNNFEKRLHYLTKYARENAGAGTSRQVFILNPRQVVKIAINTAGTSANREEVAAAKQAGRNGPFPRIFNSDPNDRWIVMELVKPMKSRLDFKAKTGIDHSIFKDVMSTLPSNDKDVNDYIDQKIVDLKHEQEKEENKSQQDAYESLINQYEMMRRSDMIALVTVPAKYQLEPGDFFKIDHLATTSDGRVVFLDFGLSPEAFDSYYVPSQGTLRPEFLYDLTS